VDYQVLFNLAVGIAGLFGGYVLSRIYTSLDKLDDDVRNIPKNYVQKDDFNIAMREVKTDIRDGFSQVERTLSNIFDRINHLAERQ
jgi:hypothetical protein